MNRDKVNILVVDDRPEKVLALEAVLEALDQNLVRAYSGREALRRLLERDFAVILLDVNMPGMDGFETAALIRQREASRDTPIIFVTAFGDEMHVARGYSLGAVDYILAPVVPEVLQTKVRVFVELAQKTEQVRLQAQAEHRRAEQLQKLAAASLTIHSAMSIEAILQVVTDTAREVIGCHQAVTLFLDPRVAGAAALPAAFGSFSERYPEWRGRPLKPELDAAACGLVTRRRTAARLADASLRTHSEEQIARQLGLPPARGGTLSAPLSGRDGTAPGLIYLAEPGAPGAEAFHADDEAVLVQLAQMASIVIENILFAEAREANRLKDEFLATLSHELRTPLNAMLGWTRLLRTEKLETAEIAHGLEVIDRNVNAQAKLIEDLLDVSRITAGKLRLNLGAVSLRAVVEAVVESCRPLAGSRGVELKLSLAEVPPMAGDADRLQQVVWNLLSNAIKFTPHAGRVDVTLQGGGERARLVVADTGRGIAPEFLPHVFDRFRQADSTSTRSQGGLGIGLTIVRHIVELHGGQVEAASDGEGRGSTFSVELPLRPPPLAPPAEPVEAVASTPAAPINASLRGVRVLVVDDEPDARELVCQVLRRCEAQVEAVASADAAREAIRRCLPDVLVSDLAMPEEDGLSLIRSLRAAGPQEGGRLPAVALTAYARDEDRRRALAAGFHQHVAKPIEPARLVSMVAALAGRNDEAALATQQADA